MSATLVMRRAASSAFARRESAGRILTANSGRVARACQDMATRFQRGGKLIVFGSGSAGTDAAHVAVEFMHPVIMGKRALPAMAVSNDAAAITGIAARAGLAEVFSHQVRQWATAADIALGISPDGRCRGVLRGLEVAGEMGLLTVAFAGGDGGAMARRAGIDHILIARSTDAAVVKEVHVTVYHLLWELVHVFFEQSGSPGPEAVR